MTVGQRIQHYRKLQGLSQEELGQKLLVSRQTVSLWENDQTLPTIDNLVRLKEIFGVSLDEILTEQSVEQETVTPQPLESYVFTYTAEEQERIRKVSEKDRFKKIARLALFSCLLCFVIYGMEVNRGCFLIVALFYTGFAVVTRLRNKKLWKKNTEEVIRRVYYYDVYEDHIYLRILLDGQLVNAQTIPLAELKLFADTEDTLIYLFDNKLQACPKAKLLPDSLLWKAGRNNSKISHKLKTAVNIVFWANIALAIASVAWFFHLSWDMELLVKQIWYCFLVLPVPIASIVLGFVLKAKGERWITNVVVGAITAAMLILFGTLSIVFKDFDLNFMDPAPNPPYIGTIERYTGIDIPEHSSVHTLDFGDQAYTSGWTTTYISSTIFFDEQAVVEFERDMQTDSRWQLNFKNELAGVMPNVYTEGRYVLVYNIDLDQWNQVPPESGDYRMLILLYDIEGNTMNAMEYILHYTK